MENPEKLIVEPTTRCNFKCDFCVKQSSGCRIAEGDLGMAVFGRCEVLFSNLKALIFSGIGEPLLNPHLEDYLFQAACKMPAGAIRGFQTNGKLLTRERAVSLIRAGLNKICISVDTVRPALFDKMRNGGVLSDIDSAFNSLNAARKEMPDTNVSAGIEFVLMHKNMDELPHLVEWAARQQADFILVTHLIPYKKELEHQPVFLNNTSESLRLFQFFQKEARKDDLDIQQYNKILWKFHKSDKEREIYKMVEAFKTRAFEKGLYVNLFHLLNEPSGAYERINHLFENARKEASKHGIALILPAIRPRSSRRCPFVEENAMFVSWDGSVSPCYFLWHHYAVIHGGAVKTVTPLYFGSLLDTGPLEIWEQADYKKFREKAEQYDYPNCHAWCETRCDYVLEAPFSHDCFISDVPCCDCYWNLGLLNCLLG